MRYDTVFLDVDGTLLWVDLDLEGYVRDLAPYAADGPLTVERAEHPIRESLHRHVTQNIEHRTEEGLAEFKLENARRTARALGVEAPAEVLTGVADRRVSFNPYPESERVLEELRGMGLGLYVVSNWDVLLGEVLEDLGWRRYFDGVAASAVVGSEKPDPGIFERALQASGAHRERVLHIGNDPETDVRGAARAGLDSALVDRKSHTRAPEATFTMPDLSGLPQLLAEG